MSWGYAGFSLPFHLAAFHFGPIFLSFTRVCHFAVGDLWRATQGAAPVEELQILLRACEDAARAESAWEPGALGQRRWGFGGWGGWASGRPGWGCGGVGWGRGDLLSLSFLFQVAVRSGQRTSRDGCLYRTCLPTCLPTAGHPCP